MPAVCIQVNQNEQVMIVVQKESKQNKTKKKKNNLKFIQNHTHITCNIVCCGCYMNIKKMNIDLYNDWLFFKRKKIERWKSTYKKKIRTQRRKKRITTCFWWLIQFIFLKFFVKTFCVSTPTQACMHFYWILVKYLHINFFFFNNFVRSCTHLNKLSA